MKEARIIIQIVSIVSRETTHLGMSFGSNFSHDPLSNNKLLRSTVS